MITPFDHCPDCDSLMPLYRVISGLDTNWFCLTCDRLIDTETDSVDDYLENFEYDDDIDNDLLI